MATPFARRRGQDFARLRPRCSSNGRICSRFWRLAAATSISSNPQVRSTFSRLARQLGPPPPPPPATHRPAARRPSMRARPAECRVVRRQPVEQRAQALCEVAEVDGRREHAEVGGRELVDEAAEIVLDDASALAPAEAPAVGVALPAPLQSQLGEPALLAARPRGLEPAHERAQRAAGLALAVAASRQADDLHFLPPPSRLRGAARAPCSLIARAIASTFSGLR